MKAVIQRRYGSPDDLQVGEIEKPIAGAGEVLVRVRAASLHPDVWHVVAGRPFVLRLMGSGFRRPRNPIPGTDLAGVVESVGSGATRFRPGDAVFGETLALQQWVNGGAYAEFAAVPEDLLARKPDNVTFAQAASVPSSGYIVLQNLREIQRDRSGEAVLINGAGGGVGSLALQVLKAQGARVTAVDSGKKLEMLRVLGADEVIDFTGRDFTRLGRRFDLVFDVPGNRSFRECRRVLKEGGRYVLIGHEGYGASGKPVFGLIPHFLGLIFLARFVTQLRGPVLPVPGKREIMEYLRDLLESGKLTPVVDSTYDLDDVREAFRHLMEDELLGKVVLTAGESD